MVRGVKNGNQNFLLVMRYWSERTLVTQFPSDDISSPLCVRLWGHGWVDQVVEVGSRMR